LPFEAVLHSFPARPRIGRKEHNRPKELHGIAFGSYSRFQFFPSRLEPRCLTKTLQLEKTWAISAQILLRLHDLEVGATMSWEFSSRSIPKTLGQKMDLCLHIRL
jgi:hypothetical protein